MITETLLVLSLAGRIYHTVPIEKMATTRRTHVCVTAPIVYRRKQQDGDWHLTIAKIVNGVEYKVVVEIIPLIPITPPRVGQIVKACGITRLDREHGNWPEIHPAESIEVQS
ncbi:MAG TPA: hypothetical protein VNM92_12555 [Thermoanaerobaculia bacterium]|nr:hypothetical protein [Thermoanaerobaculia bacterium]